MAGLLRLEAREFLDLRRWRWVLTDASGAFVADHEVRLDPADWQFEAFADLPLYLQWHAAPDRRHDDEARIVGEVGEWIGSRVLGAVGPALLLRRPAAVRVVVPAEASALLLRPLELAYVDGKPLSVQDVTLIMPSAPTGTPSRGPGSRAAPVGERLRVLGLFSLPDGGRALNLRRERYSLVQLIEGIAAVGRATQVRVLQYGVTRAAVRDALSDGEGWDIIHISGHGRPGELLLETAGGAPDLVSGPDLAGLLDAGQGRVRLVTVSACSSAATAGQQRRLLGLPDGGQADDDARTGAGTGTDSGTVATLLAARLGCAVLAMRYPVGGDFATALTGRLYELLVDKGQSLPRAVGMTLRELDSASSTRPAFSALSVATPALFGDVAANLRLAAPGRLGPLDYDTGRLKMAGFPPQASRFVGRTGVMARASAALAARSDVPGVLLHGMPGGGKTACALELAYGQEHAFSRLAWHKAPDDGMDISGALTDFALTLERYLPDFQMAHELVTSDRLAAFLPRLTELMNRCRMLLVIDNIESLLTETGTWRDDRWGLMVGALTSHTGLSRVILTSRQVPAIPTGLRVESVDALSADETLLLVHDLPHLQALGQGKLPGIDRLDARRLALRAVEAALGHPKLLELADGQAANADRLAALLAESDQAWRKVGGLPEGFFTDGEPAASGPDYRQILAAWTRSVADTLTPGERDLFWFLCCLEEPDREREVLDANWADLWRRLGRDREPPALDHALVAVAATGLAATLPQASTARESYGIHPGVAEAGRDQAGTPFQDAADTETAAFWIGVHERASGAAGGGTVDTGLLVRAGLAAVPYLLRRRRWADAAWLLEGAFLRDPSRANAAAMLPAIQQATRHDPSQADVLALVLQVLDPAAAEIVMRDYLNTIVAAGNYRAASVTAGRLMYLCLDSGRLDEALDLAGRKAGYTRQAGLGPWTQLSAEGQRLQVLAEMGQASHVLAEVTRLRDHLAALPATPGPNETASPWNTREMLLDTGRAAALRLGRWADALDLNAAQIASERDRNAPATVTAQTRFNDYGPLLRLGRTEQALALLQDCLRTFQDAHDTEMIGATLSALADTEDQRGHGEAALRLARDALRHHYLAGNVTDIAASYHNHGSYLASHARQPDAALASHLASALIRVLIGSNDDDEAVRAAATDLRVFGATAALPLTVAALDRQIGYISGTDLSGLIARLSSDAETSKRALRDLVTRALALAGTSP
jgi:tetratricopeptide (TPR) repeat protein